MKRKTKRILQENTLGNTLEIPEQTAKVFIPSSHEFACSSQFVSLILSLSLHFTARGKKFGKTLLVQSEQKSEGS